MERWKTLSRAIYKLAFISLFMGFLILLEQYIAFGVWFEIEDVHHETFSVAFFSLGFGILLGLVSERTQTQS